MAFFDPRYIQNAPPELLHTGMMDALCHAIESYVNVKSNDMTRAMGEIGMRVFSKFKDRVLTNELTEEDYQNMLIASMMQECRRYNSWKMPKNERLNL